MTTIKLEDAKWDNGGGFDDLIYNGVLPVLSLLELLTASVADKQFNNINDKFLCTTLDVLGVISDKVKVISDKIQDFQFEMDHPKRAAYVKQSGQV